MIRKLAPSILSLLLGLWLGARLLQQRATHPLVNYTVAPTCNEEEALVFHCSMHPHIQKEVQSHCPICRMPLVQERTSINSSIPAAEGRELISYREAEIQTEKVS